jgi:hypothetical protein
VRFIDLLDYKTKVGVFREITDDGNVILEYQMFPWWPDELSATLLTSVGHEQELLDMIQGVVIRAKVKIRALGMATCTSS